MLHCTKFFINCNVPYRFVSDNIIKTRMTILFPSFFLHQLTSHQSPLKNTIFSEHIYEEEIFQNIIIKKETGSSLQVTLARPQF